MFTTQRQWHIVCMHVPEAGPEDMVGDVREMSYRKQGCFYVNIDK